MAYFLWMVRSLTNRRIVLAQVKEVADVQVMAEEGSF
jgi:hypothetical protein